MPITARPELKSSGDACTTDFGMMNTLVNWPGSSGFTRSVLIRIVWSSTAVTAVTVRRLEVYGPGLPGIAGMRWMEATTSSAVNFVPSLKRTPSRSANSQVCGAIWVHLVASVGVQCGVGVLADEAVVEVARGRHVWAEEQHLRIDHEGRLHRHAQGLRGGLGGGQWHDQRRNAGGKHRPRAQHANDAVAK